jgi:6-pyruvoyltetrahydropterin/6-carboxytetrahydropterin synthase
VNPEHPLVKRLEGDARFDDLAHLLFRPGLAAEGGQLDEPAAIRAAGSIACWFAQWTSGPPPAHPLRGGARPAPGRPGVTSRNRHDIQRSRNLLHAAGEGGGTQVARRFCRSRVATCGRASSAIARPRTATSATPTFVGTDGLGGGKFRPTCLPTRSRSTGATSAPTLRRAHGRRAAAPGGQARSRALHARGFTIAVETNGTVARPEGLDWVCVSPKADTTLAIERATSSSSCTRRKASIPQRFAGLAFDHFFLQPMDNVLQQTNQRLAMQYCLAHPQMETRPADPQDAGHTLALAAGLQVSIPSCSRSPNASSSTRATASPQHKSQCRNLHGHRYALEITLEGEPVDDPSSSEHGMLMDFSDVKDIAKTHLVDLWDHAFLVHDGDTLIRDLLAQIPGHKTVVLDRVPTAENLVAIAFEILDPLYTARFGHRLTLKKLRLYETPTSWCRRWLKRLRAIQRRQRHVFELLPQLPRLLVPIGRRAEPRERGREGRVAPAFGEPRAVVDHAQRAQGLHEAELGGLKSMNAR